MAMIAPSLGLYLQFAVMDRIPGGPVWMGAVAVVIALPWRRSASSADRTPVRVRDVDGRPLARRAGGMALILAAVVAGGSLLVADTASSLVPPTGNVRWRYGGGYGPGFGGVTFDRLADLHQSIIRRSNAVVFRATLDPNAPPASEIYWRMESLGFLRRNCLAHFGQPGGLLSAGDRWRQPRHAYRGNQSRDHTEGPDRRSRSQVLPTAGVGQFFRSESVDVNGFQITPDGSAIYQAELDEGDEYEVQSILPLQDEDLGALATVPDGTLGPLFANAAEAGATSIQPGEPPGDVHPPSDIADSPNSTRRFRGRWLLARRQTAGASTSFEAAWLLQHWFRDSDEFTYSTDVSTGHDTLDLEAWLTDPDSPNAKTGYCEQFAAAMAYLGRVVGIPSRVVWGFTPGTVDEQGDGTEVVVVRDNNAHAWVEMWMDGFGWVRFDPTPRADGTLPASVTAEFDPEPYLPERGEGPISLDQPGFFDESQFEGGWRGDRSPGPAPTPASNSPGYGCIAHPRRSPGADPDAEGVPTEETDQAPAQGDITAAWDEIVDRLADLGSPVPSHQTPLEFARATDRSLVPLASSYSATVYGIARVWGTSRT